MNKNTSTPKPETDEQPSTGEGFSASDCSASVFLHLPVTDGVIKEALAAYNKGEISAAQVQNLALGWLPIATAPKDGTVILTDAGSCAWVVADRLSKEGWYLCGPTEKPATGDEFWDSHPTHWMKYPALPNVRDQESPENQSHKQVKL